MQQDATIPAHIERTLVLDILRGRYQAGSKLPTVRELAALFDANQATIQRVVARLQTLGLIVARQGSGLSVKDPHAAGDLSLLPYWLEATMHDPAQATSILEDFLEVRRVVAARLFVRHGARLQKALPALAAGAARVAEAASRGTAAFAEADIAFARQLVRATGNTAALALLNTIGRVVYQVPLVAEAMYGDPQANLASMAAVMAALSEDATDLGDAVEHALREIDRRTAARFARLLRAGRKR